MFKAEESFSPVSLLSFSMRIASLLPFYIFSGTLNEESSISKPSGSVATKSGNHSALSQAAGLTAGIAAFLVIAILAIFLFRRKLAKKTGGGDRNARPRR